MATTKLTLSRLKFLLLTACDDLRDNMDASEYKLEKRQRQKLGLMQDLLTGKFPVRVPAEMEPA